MRVLFLSPESPYPLHGGGQYRTASLLHYFARIAEVDLILFSEAGKPALLPPGLVRSQTVIPLPVHGKGTLERYWRNARRVARGVTPLIDRLSGLEPEISAAIGNQSYDVGVIEHFWLAPYVKQIENACAHTLIDMHNVESKLHSSCASAGGGLQALGHRRFAAVARKQEADLLPRFSLVLAASGPDEKAISEIAPSSKTTVYPNALPAVEPPELPRQTINDKAHPAVIVFSGNFEYHPNIDAVGYLVRQIWPLVKARRPEVRLRLVGRGDQFVRSLLPPNSGIEVSGPVPDAFVEIAQSQLVIAPLRMGSGTRIKILEGWAAARPVIATPLAAEGLAIDDGGNIALANTPETFAAIMLRLLDDPDTARRLAAGGRRTFEREYTWPAAWATLDRNLQLTRTTELSRYTEGV